MLVGVTSIKANEAVILKSLEKPSLIIDCANKADPHKFSQLVNPDTFFHTYTIPLDLLYAFRDVLFDVPSYTKEKQLSRVCITSISRLFHYQDKEENADLYVHAWTLLKELSKDVEIFIAIKNPEQLAYAKRFCDVLENTMGHTTTSQRQITDQMVSELRRFGQTLRADEYRLYEELLQKPLKYIAPITNASSMHTWAFLVLSVCVEQQRRIEELEMQVWSKAG